MKIALAVSLWMSVCCAGLVQGGGAQAAAAPSDAIPSAVNDFGFRLLHTLAAGSGKNVIVSPVSVALALAMAYNGAAGDTKAAMAKTLGISPTDDAAFNRANRQMLETAAKADPSVKVEIANALWTQSGFPLSPGFVKLTEEFYAASARSVNFTGDPRQAARIVNTWVDHNTHGKIPTIIGIPDRSTRLILTDAVYFKGGWQRPFDKKKTETRPFHLPSGASVPAPLMVQSGKYPYFETDSFQAIRLRYGNGRYVMYVFLPRKMNGLPDLAGALGSHWSEWTNRLDERPGRILLPRFESSYGSQLNAALKMLGMAVAFDPVEADFSRIYPPPPPLFINDVQHKTYFKVDEQGTEAAAATSIGFAMSMAQVEAPPPPFEMVVDHPFFVAIAEQQSGVLLFSGFVTDPTSR